MPLRGPGTRLLADDEVLYVPSVEVIIAGLVVFLVLLVVAVGLAWWGWRRLRRSGRLERGMLTLRAATAARGPRREIAGLRLEMREHLEHTERVLSSRTTAGTTVPDPLVDLLRRLHAAAADLDRHLRLLHDEPDEAFLVEVLPRLRHRANTITTHATELRQTALRFDTELDQPRRALLEHDLGDEIAGLEAGLTEVRALRDPGRAPRPDL